MQHPYEVCSQHFPAIAGDETPTQEVTDFINSLPPEPDSKIYPPFYFASASGNPMWIVVYLLLYHQGRKP